ncbi:hypothetical protein BKA93DRAFT_830368 [Sparassis latifolia]
MPTAIPRPQCSLCVHFRTRYLTNSSWSGARHLQVEKPVNLIVKGLPAVRREQLANQSWKLVGDFVLHKVVRDESPPELYLVALDPVQADVFQRVKSLVAPDEPVTPGILYVGVATVTGSIFARNCDLFTRALLPPTLLVLSLNHFLRYEA